MFVSCFKIHCSTDLTLYIMHLKSSHLQTIRDQEDAVGKHLISKGLLQLQRKKPSFRFYQELTSS